MQDQFRLIMDRLGGHTDASQSRAAEPGPPGGGLCLGCLPGVLGPSLVYIEKSDCLQPGTSVSPLLLVRLSVMLCRSLRGPCGTIAGLTAVTPSPGRPVRGRSGPRPTTWAVSGVWAGRGAERGSRAGLGLECGLGVGAGACPSPDPRRPRPGCQTLRAALQVEAEGGHWVVVVPGSGRPRFPGTQRPDPRPRALVRGSDTARGGASHRQGPGMAKPRASEGLVWPPRPPDLPPPPPPEAAGLLWRLWPSTHLQPCPLPGRPPNRRGPVTPGVSVLDPVGPARVAQARGTPPIPQPTSAPLPATPGCPVPPLPRGSPARPPPVSRPCSQQLSLQARVPAAQEGWGHVGKHPGRQEPPCSFVFLPPPFSLCFQILIKCAHHRCRHFTSF